MSAHCSSQGSTEEMEAAAACHSHQKQTAPHPPAATRLMPPLPRQCPCRDRMSVYRDIQGACDSLPLSARTPAAHKRDNMTIRAPRSGGGGPSSPRAGGLLLPAAHTPATPAPYLP